MGDVTLNSGDSICQIRQADRDRVDAMNNFRHAMSMRIAEDASTVPEATKGVYGDFTMDDSREHQSVSGSESTTDACQHVNSGTIAQLSLSMGSLQNCSHCNHSLDFRSIEACQMY